MKTGIGLLALLAGLLATPAIAEDAPELYFIAPENGAEITGPVHVVFGLRGLGVAPAGVERANTGHHHLVINAPVPEAGKPIPADAHHLHFGGGQTEAVIELPPGEHTLQLVLGNHLHVPLDPPVVSRKITITVVASDE